MALDLTQKTEKPKPFTGARIFFGVKPPKNWKANSLLRQDKVYQQMWLELHKETDPKRKEQLLKEVAEYKAKFLKKHGIKLEE